MVVDKGKAVPPVRMNSFQTFLRYVPQRQKACSVKNSSKSPLDLLIVDQEGRPQVCIVVWEREARVQDFIHPGGFKTLVL